LLSEKRKRFITYGFNRWFNAPKIIAEINEQIVTLYSSVSSASANIDGMPKSPTRNIHRLDETMRKILELQERIEKLCEESNAAIIPFVYNRPYDEIQILKLLMENGLTWNEIAAELKIPAARAERLYNKICEQADKAGIFDPHDD
jgi:hypothetical protein